MNQKKLHIMKTRPEISDQEIREMMDFDKVLKGHQPASKGSYGWPIAIVAIVGLTGLGIWIAVNDEPVHAEAPVPVQIPVIPDSSGTPSKDISSVPAQPRQEIAKKNVGGTTQQITEQKVKPEEPAVSEYIEAEPVAGYPELYSWFQKELKYPVEALRDSVEGIVSVSFVIDKYGKPDQVKILNSLGKPFDDEAERVIRSMPVWKPATINGKPVAARISMPLTFQINRTKQ